MRMYLKNVMAVVLVAAMVLSPMAMVNNQKVNAATSQTVNYALGKTVVSSSDENDSLAAKYAVDGDMSTRWSSAWKDGEWIMVDLGEICTVGAVVIYWEAAYASKYTISWSQDNVTWHDAATKGGSSYMADTCDMFYNRPVRYIKITFNQRATTYGSSIYELKVLGTELVEETTEAPTTENVQETTAQEEVTTELVSDSTIDWSTVPYAADGAMGGTLNNKYKFLALDNNGSLVNIQKPGFAKEAGLYVTFDSGIGSCSLSNYDIQGAGMILGLSSFTMKETFFTVNTATGSYKCAVYYEDGATTENVTTEAPTTETVTEVPTTEETPITPNTNLALGKKVVSSSDENASLAAQYAVDGDSNTRWSSAWRDGEWIMIDLGKIYSVGSVSIYWEAAYASKYTISWSQDNVTWHDAVTRGGSSYMADTCDMFYNRPVRYIKIKADQRATAYGTSIYEIVIKGSEYTGQTYTK